MVVSLESRPPGLSLPPARALPDERERMKALARAAESFHAARVTLGYAAAEKGDGE